MNKFYKNSSVCLSSIISILSSAFSNLLNLLSFKTIKNSLKNISIQLILLFLIAILFGQYLPLPLKSAFFALSLSLKEILLYALPFIIFSCLLSSLIANQGKALYFVGILFLTIVASNFISIMAGFGAAHVGLFSVSMPIEETTQVIANGTSLATEPEVTASLLPLWDLHLKPIISNEYALTLGLIVGIIFSIFHFPKINHIASRLNHYSTFFLRKLFIPVLPLFAFGFILKLDYDGILLKVVKAYAPIFGLIFLATCVYLFFMFGLAARFKRGDWFRYIKNVMPAGIVGFTTISSLATMPVTINAAEKNTADPKVANAVIPATVNIHMVGDSLGIPILAIAILIAFGFEMPTLSQYMVFTGFFMIAKFAVPGVPSGTILVMLPLLEQYLGFTTEMSAFMAAIYLLFDPIITAGNVLGNSALVIMLSKIFKKMQTS